MKKRNKLLISILCLLSLGLCIPQKLRMPVAGASSRDFNKDSFWYHPWGRSVTHKGVDIFAKKGTLLNSSISGFVVYKGHLAVGGNVVLILGAKWRLHYFAHLEEISTSIGWVYQGEKIGFVGDSGNAKGKPPHLHYSIVTLIPYLWKIDDSPQGWKKMFYLNPIPFLNPE